MPIVPGHSVLACRMAERIRHRCLSQMPGFKSYIGQLPVTQSIKLRWENSQINRPRSQVSVEKEGRVRRDMVIISLQISGAFCHLDGMSNRWDASSRAWWNIHRKGGAEPWGGSLGKSHSICLPRDLAGCHSGFRGSQQGTQPHLASRSHACLGLITGSQHEETKGKSCLVDLIEFFKEQHKESTGESPAVIYLDFK